MTGKQVAKTAKTSNAKAAQRTAGVWEDELRAGRYKAPSRTTWAEFRQQYEADAFPNMAEATHKRVLMVLRSIESILNPDLLSSLTTERTATIVRHWRDVSKVSENTTRGNLAHAMASLKWTRKRGILNSLPVVSMPKRTKGGKLMKGRPITGEEFDRMLSKVSEVGPAGQTEKVKRFLRGLWLSGLRLSEAMDFWWDREDRLRVDLSGRRPMMRVHASQEKGGQDRLLPMTPDFAEFLLATPKDERHGMALPLRRWSMPNVSEMISKIGEAAGVKVNTDPQTGKVKYASAHELRRSFGERWSKRVMPAVLMQLMRHENINTTMKYYVGQNADAAADAVWEAMGSLSGNIPSQTPQEIS